MWRESAGSGQPGASVRLGNPERSVVRTSSSHPIGDRRDEQRVCRGAANGRASPWIEARIDWRSFASSRTESGPWRERHDPGNGQFWERADA